MSEERMSEPNHGVLWKWYRRAFVDGKGDDLLRPGMEIGIYQIQAAQWMGTEYSRLLAELAEERGKRERAERYCTLLHEIVQELDLPKPEHPYLAQCNNPFQAINGMTQVLGSGNGDPIKLKKGPPCAT